MTRLRRQTRLCAMIPLMNYLITFLEGVITFISPCMLPLLPVYAAYFAGGVSGSAAGAADASAADSARLRATARAALGFVLGFGLLFTAMGAFAGTLGGLLVRYQTALNIVCGIIVVFMGLSFMGVLNIPLLQRTVRLDAPKEGHGFFASLLLGAVFAIGWTPCVGAFLASALSLAATTGSTLQGVLLLACYSLGLGVPFFLAAILIDRLEGAFGWVKRHYRVINLVCGGLLVVVGVLMATGHLGLWLGALSRLTSASFLG